MIDDIMRKFPELVQALLQKVSQIDSFESPKRKNARDELISKLKETVDELSRLSQQPGERLSEEQMKEILAIPRPSPVNIPLGFLIDKKEKK